MHESHIIQWLCAIQREPEGPKDKNRVYERRAMPYIYWNTWAYG